MIVGRAMVSGHEKGTNMPTFEKIDANSWDIWEDDECIGSITRVYHERYAAGGASLYAIDRSRPPVWHGRADGASFPLPVPSGATFHTAKRAWLEWSKLGGLLQTTKGTK